MGKTRIKVRLIAIDYLREVSKDSVGLAGDTALARNLEASPQKDVEVDEVGELW